uniref:Uncharacterized protein n=1 Tax=Aegilops tauschii subsp. strangulata TaxID=200361 RepID=A0A453J7Q5_AEGTS
LQVYGYTGQRLAAVTRSGNQDARRRRSTAASSRLPESPRRDPPRPPKALAAILRSRVIACLRAQDGETAMQAAHAAVRGGVSVLEIVMSTPGVLEVVEDLRKSYPSLTFGVSLWHYLVDFLPHCLNTYGFSANS